MKTTILAIGVLLVVAISFSGCMGSSESSDSGSDITQATQGEDPFAGGDMGPPPDGGPDGGPGGPPGGF
jgi:hypothetical protein